MKKPLALWKQILIVTVLAGTGYGLWHERDRLTQLAGISIGKEREEEARGGRGARGGNKVPVIVGPVKIVQSVDSLQAVGNGLAKMSVTIFPEVTGRVSEIDFVAGKQVKAGDVILKLDDAQTRIAVDIARAQVEETRRVLNRNVALLPREVVAQATVDTSRTALETAELQLRQAEEALADRTIRAPFDGVLGIPQVEVGDRISESTAITTLDDRSSVIVEFDIPEIYLKQLKPGYKVTATTAGFRGREFEGEITEIDSRIDTATRAVRLRASLRNEDDVLRGGMSFVVNLVLEGGNYPSIPELALLWEREGSYVWRVSGGAAEIVKVSVIKRSQGEVLVEGPLSSGELVVVEGTQRLRPGREVTYEMPVAANQGRETL